MGQQGTLVSVVANRAAPPRTLADLRKAMQPDVRKRVIAEIDKDLTKHPIFEIERHLTA
jgi:protein required for attachment to host cells